MKRKYKKLFPSNMLRINPRDSMLNRHTWYSPDLQSVADMMMLEVWEHTIQGVRLK